MFKVNEEIIPDNEVVNAYKQMVANRKKWCDNAAREYFAEKKISQCYKLDVYYPEMDDTVDFVLSEERAAEYRAFVEKCKQEFIDNGEAYYEKGVFDEEAWNDWLSDSYMEAGFTEELWISGCPVHADVRNVDLEDTTNVYKFATLYFKDEDEQPEKTYRWVTLTDEQYINILSDTLFDSYVTTNYLYFKYPDAFKAIMRQTTVHGKECAVFLTEIKSDVKAILDARGDDMPKMPEGPFAEIAAWLASKEE